MRVRADDTASEPATLTIIGEVAAGHPFEGAVGPGEAARIFTGGVVPAGADCVVIQEVTERDGDRVDHQPLRHQGPQHPPQGHRLQSKARCCSSAAAASTTAI